MIRDDAFATQQNVKSSIPEAPPFCSKIAKALPEIRIIGETKNASIRLAITTCDSTGFTLAKADLFNHRPSSSSPLRGY